ncbi:EAL domain-containing protein [Glaciecola siphonariae]|uniref:EAL domain-containing protein n=1 Tax=Glaciecola siphonariae TaxID=521012 RepID=A0ABV9LXV1_9ALTE
MLLSSLSRSFYIVHTMIFNRVIALVCGVMLFSSFILISLAEAQTRTSEHAAEYTVSADFDTSISLSSKAEFLLTEENLLLSDVMQQQQWQTHKEIVNIPEGASLWLRFEVFNPSDSNRLLTLVAGNAFIDRAEAFLLDEQLRIIQSSRLQGDVLNTATLSRNGFKMSFTARSASTFAIYLQIQDDGLSVIPIELWQSQAYTAQASVRLILLGAMSGGLSLLATYFLLTYVLRNAPSRFWFCVFSTAAMTTMLSTEGILPMMFMIPSYAAELTAISLTVMLFAAIKITRIIFEPVSKIWLRAHYVLLLFPLIGIFIFNDFYQLISLIVFSCVFFVSKLLATLIYRKGLDLRSAIIYFSGWVALGIVGIIELLTLLNNTSHLSFAAPYPFIFSCLGVMMIGVAIISREQSIQALNSHNQMQQINHLQQYNDLFQHAAEGLYTAKPNGELIHVNPAICSLFGYTDSKSFLSTHPHLSSFFASSKDADLLLGELSIQQTVLGKEVKGKRSDGSEFWFSISAQLKKVQDNALQFGSLFDITERRLHQINLQYLNTHDQLTGLYNRRYFLQIMNERIEQTRDSDADSQFALVFLDVDQFKVINDTCGHSAGDVFVKELSHELFDVVGDKYVFARLSADQFGLLVDFDDINEISALASQMLEKVRAFEFKWDRHIFTQSISIGIAAYESSIPSGEELLSYADTACLIAKESGQDKIHIYSSEMSMHSSYQRDLYWVSEVKNAVKEDKLELFYQHYRPLGHADEHDYYEILVRLRTKENDLVAPEFFMPSAEKANISHHIDKCVIEHYFQWLHAHPEHMDTLCKANINLSGFSLSDDDFRFFLLNAFEKYHIPHEKICFEITETMAIIRMKDAIEFMNEFKKLGCTFALDDFGTGFSSYSYLKNLPVDYLKIDGNFIRDILNDKIDLAMVTSIRDVAEAMKIKTVAEFVETTDIMVQIGKLGLDFAQGFCIAKPKALAQYRPFKEEPPEL